MSRETMSRKELIEVMQARKESRTLGNKDISLSICPRGGVQVKGVCRFPISFTQKEWETLFSLQKQVEQFIQENQDKLLSDSSE